MLLRNRLKFPSLRKKPQKINYVAKVQANYNTRQLPLEIQEIICFMVLGEDKASRFALNAMRVCKTWASFICERMYR